jgi:hypothetical protein
MSDDFYWVFFFIALFGCAALGFGLSVLLRSGEGSGRAHAPPRTNHHAGRR